MDSKNEKIEESKKEEKIQRENNELNMEGPRRKRENAKVKMQHIFFSIRVRLKVGGYHDFGADNDKEASPLPELRNRLSISCKKPSSSAREMFSARERQIKECSFTEW